MSWFEVRKEAIVAALQEGRARIEDIEHWTQGEYMKDKTGWTLYGHERKHAHCFCAYGAIMYPRDMAALEAQEAYSDVAELKAREAALVYTRANSILQEAAALFQDKYPGVFSVLVVNDDKAIPREEAHKNVLALYDHAIAIAQAMGPAVGDPV